MNNLAIHNGVIIRADTHDINILNNIENDYGELDVAGKVVLDGGACFGAFSVWALRNRAKEVHVYEPDFENRRITTMNLSFDFHKQFFVFPYAIGVGDGHGYNADFHSYIGENRGMNSLIRRDIENHQEQISSVEITGLRFSASWGNPQIIKLDIEGTEVELFDDILNLPSHVEQIAIELHMFDDEMREKCQKFVADMEEWGLVAKHPDCWSGNETAVGVWKR